MSTRFVNVDRHTPMLLPPDLRDWISEDDMVHFVIEAVEGMYLRNLRVNRRGSGSEQYPPTMMLALLIYCYANGIFSSRRIERATYRDIAVRFLTADTHPDHDTIYAFRRVNFEATNEAERTDRGNDNDGQSLPDADSRLMRKNTREAGLFEATVSPREGFTQSYNNQTAVDADGSQMVLSHHVSQSAGDANELERAVNNIPESIGKVNKVLADSGYVNADAIERLQEQGRDLYVAVSRDDGNTKRRYDYRPKSATDKPGRKYKDPRLRAMQRKLRTQAGKNVYAKRKQTVEPVFGIIKQVMGYRQTLLRRVEKVSGEWHLVCLAYNVKRLWMLKAA